jgi:single-strand DNA-binding protein
MAGLCKVTLIGNLGADPEMRYTTSGKAVTKFRVACNSRRRMPDGEFQEHTEWFGVSAFTRLAEIASEYLHKGSKVYVEGRLESRTWDSPDGKRFFLDVIASDLQLLDSRAGGDGGEFSARSENAEPPSKTPTTPQQGGGGDDFDDVPF